MGYVIASRYCALTTDTLATEDQLRSFTEFCWEKLDEANGDPRDYGVDYPKFYTSPKDKRLFIEFRQNWDKTEIDQLYDNGAYPKCTLVIIVPDIAPVSSEVLEKMDMYQKMLSQKPSKRTAVSEDFELIEVFRRRAESIRNTASKPKSKDVQPKEQPLPVDVNVTNMLSKKDIADAAFVGMFRTMTRFKEPENETPMDKIHRLHHEGVKWKEIAKKIYYDEHGDPIHEKDLKKYVDKLRQQYKKVFPDSYKIK